MSDADDETAWRLPPARYLAARPVEHSPPARLISRYIAMADGVRLALDLYLPAGASGKLSAIVVLTPYYRRFALAPDAPATTEPSPNAGRWRDLFVPRGYALVVVDVRGSGASFGTRDSFRSPRERRDDAEIAAWIASQDWSDGHIGATGISYVGAAADFLASTGHPAVRAIAPISAVWDTYADHYYPGGMLLQNLAGHYDSLMQALDRDRRKELARFAYFKDPAYRGPAPVDEDTDGRERDRAVAEHGANFRMPAFLAEFPFRNSALPYEPAFTPASFSPCGFAADIPRNVAIFSISGWMDGAGYANGAIARFLTLPNEHRHLLLGPWDHGARINVSPWRKHVVPQFALDGALLRFFDHYLRGMPTGLEAEEKVHYFSLHAERWRTARVWPPPATSRRLFPAPDGVLAEAAGTTGIDPFRADFTRGTGEKTRYGRLAAFDVRDYYTDWAERSAPMLHYVSAPLGAAGEMTGHATLSLRFSASEPDAAIFAYLSEIEADGSVRYITEGMLRALHRAERPAPAEYRATWPWHSHARVDAAPLAPNEPASLNVAFLPVSWTFSAGSRIRLSLAGADADHFGQVPHGRPPLLRVHRGGSEASMLTLPWRE
ncbi:MAG: CocE/NonD family hydrolase [Rhodospirillales bacterium]|nr:CocE/NonD family hydrolase [Rhodospirillales bacterium]